MGTPSVNESGPAEPALHPGDDPSKDTVSEDLSSDSNGDSDAESGDSSDRQSIGGSGSDSSSSSGDDSQSSVSSEPSGSFKIRVAVLKPATVQICPSLVSPHVVIGGSVDQVVGPSVQSVAVVEPVAPLVAASPVIATPGKSLMVPASSPAIVPVVIPSTPSRVLANHAQLVQNLQFDQKLVTDGAPPEPESLTPRIDATSDPATVNEAPIEIDFDQMELMVTTTSKPGELAPVSSKTKSTGKKSGSSSKSAAEERYLNKVLKVERALVRAEKGKKRKKAAERKKGGKQPKGPPRKKKKSKTRVSSSSEDDSSDSSSSSASSTASESVPLDKIARIPTGRLLQQCALSRMNELNLAKEPDSKLSQITEALRLIDDFVLKPGPDMAFSFFNQVPGSGLPHLEKHIDSFKGRYCALVRSVVKFHLLLIQKALIEKKAAVNPDANSPMFLLWQFSNDLARAPSTSTYIAPSTFPASPMVTPSVKTPKSKRSRKSKKSSSKTLGKSKGGSGKRVSSPKKRKRKHGRGDKKAKKGNKKRKRNDSSSNVSLVVT